jgi:inner membrane protein
MDSLSQFALGAAVTLAVMGRRTAAWKAVLWGGIAGTLPDLDALIDFGDVISNMVRHRAESHGLFYLALASPLLGALAAKLSGDWPLFKRWWAAMAAALITHPLLDWFTIYGTQLAQPFSDAPYGLGSMFIIDPAYTLPLVVGIAAALVSQRGQRWNTAALVWSCAYLAWSALMQAHVLDLARTQMAARGLSQAPMFATPAPLQTVLWRVVVMTPSGYEEGFYSPFDGARPIRFDAFNSDANLRAPLQSVPLAAQVMRFNHGFHKVEVRDNQAVVTDLRMGQDPNYVFSFAVAKRDPSGAWQAITPRQIGNRGDAGRAFPWLWARMWGAEIAPPR